MTEETIKKIENCKYRLPCGWCDRLNDKCIFEQERAAIKSLENQDTNYIKKVLDTQTEKAICIHEWEPVNNINTTGYVYRCRKCGATKIEPITRGLQEYITTSGNEEFNKKYSLWNSDSSNNSCEHCSNNPKNGGSGVCHCILGSPKVTCTTLGTISAEGASSEFVTGMCTDDDIKNQPTLEELANMTTVASTKPIIAHSDSSEIIKTKRRKS